MVRNLKNIFSKNSKDEKIKELEEIIEDGMQHNNDLKKMVESLFEENINLRKENKKLKDSSIGSVTTKKKFYSKSFQNEKKIKEILKEMPGISITKLSEKIGISRQAIYKTYKHLLS